MQKITVNTAKSYDILIDSGILSDIPSLILPFCKTKRVLIVTDDIVDSLYGEKVFSLLKNDGYTVFKFVFKNGEEQKNISTLSDILEFAAECGIKRNDLFLSLGGGVTGDITGLASALYMRGVSVVQIPTTLLSAVDSSVGGKTAVDLKAGKNLAGVFCQPSLVIIDTDIIKNLPEDIFKEGLGEVIKYGVIKSPDIIDVIESGKIKQNLSGIIKECLIIKKEIVEQDELDTLGIRNLLNAGHTVAHSTELLSGYTVPHGIAVANGLLSEAKIAEKLGICEKAVAERIKNVLISSRLYEEFNFSKAEIANTCLKDKKNRDSKILFLLPETIGTMKEVKLSSDELLKLL